MKTGTRLGMAPQLDELRVRAAEIHEVAARRGAGSVRVFGSVARGDARPDSDVDFLVTFEPDRSLFDLGGLIVDLEDLLGWSVDVVTLEELRPRMRDRVIQDMIEHLDLIEEHRPATLEELRVDVVRAAAILRWL